MTNIIQTEDLEFSYPADEEGMAPLAALRGVTVSIEEGSFVVVLGHNGSGKSTLAKHMNAVLLPTGGAVYVSGMNTRDDALLLEIRRRVGMVFQNPDNQLVANVASSPMAFMISFSVAKFDEDIAESSFCSLIRSSKSE